MVIKNLTCKAQKLVVKEITGEHREYDMFFQPHSSVELDRFLTVVHPEKYKGIFDFGEVIAEVKVENPAEDVKAPVEETKEEVESPVEEPKEEVEAPTEESKDTPSAFICDVCGAEFASARGLASHKNKAHAE